MKTAYTTHGLLFENKDVAIIIGDYPDPIEAQVPMSPVITTLFICEKIYVNPDFNKHKIIDVQLGNFIGSNFDPEETIRNGSSFFEINCTFFENSEMELQIENRNFKLEHLSMELQQRIHKVAEEMYQDWLKVKHY